MSAVTIGRCLPTAFAFIFHDGIRSLDASFAVGSNQSGDELSYVDRDKSADCEVGEKAHPSGDFGPPYVMGSPFPSSFVLNGAGVWNVTVFSQVTGSDSGGFRTTAADDDSADFRRRCAVGSVLTLFAVFTVTGNALVMAAVACEPCLRATVTNYFVVSLAVADLIIGAAVMPFGIVIEVTGGWWPFGPDWCDLWHSVDVLASTASILNLSVIALDRYWAITDPIAYPGRMSTMRASAFIVLVWVCSAAISFPAIFWWRHSASAAAAGAGVLPDGEELSGSSDGRDLADAAVAETTTSVYRSATETCQFTDDSGYLIFSSLVSFYGPVSVILFAYYRIYAAAAAQMRSLERGSKVLTTTGGGVSTAHGASEVMTLRIHRGGGGGGGGFGARMGGDRALNGRRHTETGTTQVDTVQSSTSRQLREVSGRRSTLSSGGGSSMIYRDDLPAEITSPTTSSTSRLRWNTLTVCRRRLGRVARERKAAKTLGIVMGVFCACWVPFFVTNLLYGLCRHVGCVRNPELLFGVFTWLGYANSGMNPVIYACSMRDFRRAFGRLLCRRLCRRYSSNMHATVAGGRSVAVYRRSAGAASVGNRVQLRRTVQTRHTESDYSSGSFIY